MEVGMVFVSNLGLPNEHEIKYSRMFNPQVGISSYASKVTGITDKMIKDLDPIEKHKEEIQEYLDAADVIVFHGGTPDVYALINSGFNVDETKILDTQTLAKMDKREFDGYSLKHLANIFKMKYVGEHRALNDALITMQIYRELAYSDHPLFQECNENLINVTV